MIVFVYIRPIVYCRLLQRYATLMQETYYQLPIQPIANMRSTDLRALRRISSGTSIS